MAEWKPPTAGEDKDRKEPEKSKITQKQPVTKASPKKEENSYTSDDFDDASASVSGSGGK